MQREREREREREFWVCVKLAREIFLAQREREREVLGVLGVCEVHPIPLWRVLTFEFRDHFKRGFDLLDAVMSLTSAQTYGEEVETSSMMMQ